MRSVPSAYWIDKADKITCNTTDTLEGILRDAASVRPAPLVVVIFYDLPNRDCRAKASNGEICCNANPDGKHLLMCVGARACLLAHLAPSFLHRA